MAYVTYSMLYVASLHSILVVLCLNIEFWGTVNGMFAVGSTRLEDVLLT